MILTPPISFSTRFSGESSVGTRFTSSFLNSSSISERDTHRDHEKDLFLLDVESADELSRQCFTSEPPIEVRVGGHLEAGVRQQEAADVGEAGVDVLPHILQLFVLVLFHLCQQTTKHSQLSAKQIYADLNR